MYNDFIKKGRQMLIVYYDITTPDTAYNWIYDTLQINQGMFLESYLLKCNKDIDLFCKMYAKKIEKLDIENLEIVAFQVTSNSDNCESVKKHGIRNLQWVLSNDTEMNKLIQKNGISFDLEQKAMYIDSKKYDVDYDKYKGKFLIEGDELESIAHKLFYDFQINAFLFCKDIGKYSVIYNTPEFLYTLAQFSQKARLIEDIWKEQSDTYVVKYKAKIDDFAWFTFYDKEESFYDDQIKNYWCLKNKLIMLAIDGMNGELSENVFAYMNQNTVILPQNILEIIPAEEWRINVLKYFGKA